MMPTVLSNLEQDLCGIMIKQYLPLLSLVFLFGLIPTTAHAYGTDVHFNLTYILCRLAGIQAKNALWIAAADQSMDENKCTTALSEKWNENPAWQSLPFTDKVWTRNGQNFHAFSDADGKETISPRGIPTTIHYSSPGIARQAIRKRMDDLWSRVQSVSLKSSDENTVITSEISMGQFLHFEQDYFSHRQMTPDCVDEQKWLPYGTFWGHFKDGHRPDYVVERPMLALFMVQDTYKWMCLYAATLPAHSTPAKLSKEDILSLIADLSAVYPHHVVRPHHINDGTMSAKLGNPPDVSEDTIVYDDIPSQADANKALIKALSHIEHATPMGELPRFTADYTLPYDKPQTPLKTVKEKFNNL